MRGDLVIDGFGIGKLEVSGSDASRVIMELFHKLERNDINLIILSGSVLSVYNIVNIELLSEKLKVPIVALSFKKSKANLAENIKAKFSGEEAMSKLKLLRKLGPSQKVKLNTGYSVFARNAGLSDLVTKRVLDKFTLQGAIPEPVRVARLLAKAVAVSLKDSVREGRHLD